MPFIDRNANNSQRLRRNQQRLKRAGEETFPLALNLNPNGGLEDTSNLGIKLDGATLSLSASGLKVADDGIGAAQLGILTTKGDLITYSTLPARLGVGDDGQVLTASSAEALGLVWADMPSGGIDVVPVVGEEPDGLINSSNDTYTLANTPEGNTEAVYLDGVRFTRDVDYTISGDTITMTTPPTGGSVLRVDYFIMEASPLFDEDGALLVDEDGEFLYE